MTSKPYYRAVAFISDIHANLEALEAVLADIEKQNVSAIYCLGDIVGYGPDPIPCVRKIMELTEAQKILVNVCGNHDYGVSKKELTLFNSAAKTSNEWTIEQLEGTEESKFLDNMCKDVFVKEVGRFCMVHSTLNPAPDNWEYMKIKNAADNFIERKLVFVGHSHVPAIYSKYSSGKGWYPITLFGNSGHYFLPPVTRTMLSPGKANKQYRIELSQFPTMIVNVGSVGQPRDENPNARYVIHLTIDYKEYLEYRQVGYDVQKAVMKHKERGLSCDARLAARLCTGGTSRFEESPRPDWFPFD